MKWPVFAAILTTILLWAHIHRLNIKAECELKIDRVMDELYFRNQQCDLVGARNECYSKNIELSQKDIKMLMYILCNKI